MLVAASIGSSAAQDRVSSIDSLIARLYEERGGRLAWSPSEARALVRALTRARDEGLDPEDYLGTVIDSLLAPGHAPDNLARLDSLLSRAFFSYASDVSHGRVDPAAVDSLWRAAPHGVDLVRMLEGALESGHVEGVLRALSPPQPGYAALRRALQRYRASAAQGGWSVVPSGPSLEPGAHNARVAVLRTRLLAEGYPAPAEGDVELFDGTLEAAVRDFQERHGLVVDGAVGSATRFALNVSAAARVRQIASNLERWRWLPRFLGQRYVVVNSAAFTLDVVDGGQRVLGMRAIVGRTDWPTPIVSSRITEAVFRPAWHVPRAIAKGELLGLVQRDPRYLTREGIRVLADSAAGGDEIDPATVDWRTVTESTFTYQLVQEPGPTNPLGGVRFVFWTPFDVFIHDTPVRPLFTERFRTFSHGCVRVEQAADLAAYLLPEWSVDSIRSALTAGRERRIRVSASIPVHLVYWTAWTDERGDVQFRGDVYGWDQRLGTALEGRAASAALPQVVSRSPERVCGR